VGTNGVSSERGLSDMMIPERTDSDNGGDGDGNIGRLSGFVANGSVGDGEKGNTESVGGKPSCEGRDSGDCG